MTEPAPELFQYWTHSFEEDEEGTAVYRPSGHRFPPARGRAGLELRPDGTAVRWRIGRGDAPEPLEGSWHVDASGTVRLSFPVQAGDATGAAVVPSGQAFDVLDVKPEVLRVREAG